MAPSLFGVRIKDEMSPAIGAINSAVFGHGQKYTRMTRIGGTAVAVKFFGIDGDGFGWRAHGSFIPKGKIKTL